jgi:GH15 family glucan-1,4-alpha-glucosidase
LTESAGNRYLPIEDYAAIGNLRTVVLVGRNGSIDWACLPHFDSPSVFAAILDARRGGHFRVSPPGMPLGEQRYQGDTNILETTFRTEGGLLHVVDFMPLHGNIEGRSSSQAPPEIHRLVRAEGGSPEVELEWAPRLGYGGRKTRISIMPGGLVAGDGERNLYLRGLPEGTQVETGEDGPLARARLRLEDGQRLALVTSWEGEPRFEGLAETEQAMEATAQTWQRWLHKDGSDEGRDWAGEWAPLIKRSELALKLMVFSETGGIVAAPTTSLPEWIGGIRNWDYRYTWIRDASLTSQALSAVGHLREAVDFLDWAERVAQAHQSEARTVQIMYGIHGQTELDEYELEHFEGYRGSAPVRIGNGAAPQRQLDVYGELLDGAYELVRQDIALSDDVKQFLAALADGACSAVGEKDSGIWEIRGPERYFVHSQLMVWVGLDRALQLAKRGIITGDVSRWHESRDKIRAMVLERGYNEEVGAFTQSFGSHDLDASNLLIPLHELLPFDDPRVQGTIDRTLEGLTEEGLVYRYKMDDGLPGKEGAFVLCTFWLIDTLALSGRLDEARALFDRLCGRVNHVGLLSEQIDPATGAFLGNFPQAFSHIGLINSALYLAYAEGRPTPSPAPLGSQEHRAEMSPSR